MYEYIGELNSEYINWLSRVGDELLARGYVVQNDPEILDTITFLYQDDCTVNEAVEFLLS